MTAESTKKYFVGQDFKSGAKVLYDDQATTDYEVTNFDPNTIGQQTATISKGDKTTTLAVEVLSKEAYIAYVEEELDKQIISTNFTIDIIESQPTIVLNEGVEIPEADLKFDLKTFKMEMDSNDTLINIYINGQDFYISQKFGTNSANMIYDNNTHTLYEQMTTNGVTKSYKFVGSSALDCLKMEGKLTGIADEQLAQHAMQTYLEINTNLMYYSMINILKNATLTEVSVSNGVLTLGENEYSLDYENFFIKNGTPEGATFEFNGEVTIPEIPADVEWTEVTWENISTVEPLV